MVDMLRGQELHKRSCSGERLTQEEQTELDAWYSLMDSDEAMALNRQLSEPPTNDEIRAEIRSRLSELQAAIEIVRDTEERNALLRQQNEELKRQLVAKGLLAA